MNPEDRERYLSLLYEATDLVHIQCIRTYTDDAGHKQNVPVGGYGVCLPRDEFIAKLPDLDDLNYNHQANIYSGVNPRPSRFATKSENVNVAGVISADVDGVADEKRLLEQIAKAGLPEPTLLINSGHGFHVYWKLAQRVHLATSAERRRFERRLRWVQRIIGADHTCDLARLLRLPGFWNVKNLHDGRPATECRIVSIDESKVYPVELFDVAMQATREKADDDARQNGEVAAALKKLDVPRDDRSKVDFHVCCELQRLGVRRAQAWRLVAQTSKFATRDRKYFNRTWAAAIRQTSSGSSSRSSKRTTANSLPDTVKVLGIDADNRIFIWAQDIRRLHIIERLRDLDHATWILICGDAKWRPSVDPKPLVAIAARARPLADIDQLGAGVHAVDDVAGVVVNFGGRPFRVIVEPGSPAVIEEIDTPSIGGKILLPVAEPSANHGEELRAAIENAAADPTFGRDTLDAFEALLRCWSFTVATVEQFASLVAASPLSGALPFRPMAWVTGASDCGKSALLTTVAMLFPNALRLEGDSSEAALRQSIRRDALLILFDEFEATPRRARVKQALRSTTRGGIVRKGSSSGQPVLFTLRSIVIVASIDVELSSDADRNRFIVFELNSKRSRIVLPKKREAAELGRRLTAAVIVAAADIITRFDSMFADDAVEPYRRACEAHAVGVAVRASLRGWTHEQSIGVLLEILKAHHDAMSTRYDSEGEALVRDIATSLVTPGENSPTVAEAILNELQHEHALKRVGIRTVARGNVVNVFLAPDLIQRHLLQRTRWAESNIGDVLARLSGARRTRSRLSEGVNVRGIEMPLATFCDVSNWPKLADEGDDAAA